MAKLTNRSLTATVRISPENLAAAELVARVTGRTVSGLFEYALALYMHKNYPAAYAPGAKVSLRLDEAPSDMGIPISETGIPVTGA